MALREEYAGKQPLEGARIVGVLHMTIQTAVLIETLQALGASVRWSSWHLLHTRSRGGGCGGEWYASLREKGYDRRGVLVGIDQTMRGPDGWTLNMILDDGVDLTVRMHEQAMS